MLCLCYTNAMRKGRLSSGYTIIEIMVVLAVSSVLLVSGLLLVNGQQQKTQFRQSLDDINSSINTVINNVAAGYYTHTGNFMCTVGASPIITTGGSNSRGTNTGCTYIGRAMQFGVGGTNGTGYNIYDLVGLQYQPSTTNDVTSLIGIGGAEPTAIAPGTTLNTSTPSTAETKFLGYGLNVVAMKFGATPIGAFAIVTDFAQQDVNGNLNNGSRKANLVAIANTSLNMIPGDAVDAIDQPDGANFSYASDITICFDSGLDKFGIITMGHNSRQLTTDERIVDKSSNPAECS